MCVSAEWCFVTVLTDQQVFFLHIRKKNDKSHQWLLLTVNNSIKTVSYKTGCLSFWERFRWNPFGKHSQFGILWGREQTPLASSSGFSVLGGAQAGCSRAQGERGRLAGPRRAQGSTQGSALGGPWGT